MQFDRRRCEGYDPGHAVRFGSQSGRLPRLGRQFVGIRAGRRRSYRHASRRGFRNNHTQLRCYLRLFGVLRTLRPDDFGMRLALTEETSLTEAGGRALTAATSIGSTQTCSECSRILRSSVAASIRRERFEARKITDEHNPTSSLERDVGELKNELECAIERGISRVQLWMV